MIYSILFYTLILQIKSIFSVSKDFFRLGADAKKRFSAEPSPRGYSRFQLSRCDNIYYQLSHLYTPIISHNVTVLLSISHFFIIFVFISYTNDKPTMDSCTVVTSHIVAEGHLRGRHTRNKSKL